MCLAYCTHFNYLTSAKDLQKLAVDSPMRNSTDIFLHRRFILSCCQAVWPMMVWRHGRHLGSSSGIAQHRPLLKITQAPPCSRLCITHYIPCSGVFEVCFILHTLIGDEAQVVACRPCFIQKQATYYKQGPSYKSLFS